MTTKEIKMKTVEMQLLINNQQLEEAKEIFDEIAPLILKAIDDFIDVWNRVMQIIASMIDAVIVDLTNIIVDTVISAYPKKKVVNLALHHPRAKVRRKNKRRIFKWLKKMLYYDFQYSVAKEVIM